MTDLPFAAANERRSTRLQPVGRLPRGGSRRKRRVETGRRPAALRSGLEALQRYRLGELSADLVAGGPFDDGVGPIPSRDDQPDAAADFESAFCNGHEAALGNVDDPGFDAAGAELAHLGFEVDRKARQAPTIALVLRDARLDRHEAHLHPSQLRRSREGQSDAPVLHPSHLCRYYAPVKKLERQALADIRQVWENDHGSRRGNIDQPDDMLAAAKFEHCRTRNGGMPSLGALIDMALLAARNHCAIKKEA